MPAARGPLIAIAGLAVLLKLLLLLLLLLALLAERMQPIENVKGRQDKAARLERQRTLLLHNALQHPGCSWWWSRKQCALRTGAWLVHASACPFPWGVLQCQALGH